MTTDVLESLSVKSAAGSSDGRQLDINAVLCTDSQTFHIRQIHSSNSVFVAQPSEAQNSDVSNLVSNPSLCVIAQCTATLELLPSSDSVISYLQKTVPEYTESGHAPYRGASSANATQERGQNKATIYDDAPFSRAELDLAWKQMCAFEIGQVSLRPTTLTLIEVWRSMMSAVILRSLNAEENFAVKMILGSTEEERHPAALIEAVVSRLAMRGTGQTDGSGSTYSLL